MNFLADDTTRELRAEVRRMLADRAPLPSARTVAASDLGYDRDVWTRLHQDFEVGRLALPEASGGTGSGCTTLAVVVEEAGAVLLPGPLLGSTIACGFVLDAVGERNLTRQVAEGAVIAALVSDDSLSVVDGLLTGSAPGVLDGLNADIFVVVAGDDIYTVEAHAAGVGRVAMETLDMTRRQARVSFDGARACRIGDRNATMPALDRASVALAAEQLGVMRRSVEMAVEYAKQRVQFDRIIGSFQAVKHGLADMHASYELGIGAVSYAAWAADHAPDELSVAASLARAYLSPAAFSATFEMIQYHGGIGYTWDHDAHLLFKRAKSDESLFGETETHRQRLAEYLLG